MKKPSIRLKRPSSNTAKQKFSFSFKQSAFLVVFASVLALGATGYYYYQNVFTDPARILSDAVDKSLQTTSVTRTVTQTGTQNSVSQKLYVSYGPAVVSQSVTDLQESSSVGKTAVKTESIGTKDTDYVRYQDISVTGQDNVERKYNNVVGTWGKRQSDEQTGQSVSFLDDALFVIVPFGNLNPEQRAVMRAEINKSGVYDITSTKQEFNNARPVMTYRISVNPQKLVQVLSKYVEVTGVGSNQQLDPRMYEGASDVQIDMEIDMLSKHITKVNFADSGRVETYTAYNAERSVPLPKDTVSIEELQNRLSEVEQQAQNKQ